MPYLRKRLEIKEEISLKQDTVMCITILICLRVFSTYFLYNRLVFSSYKKSSYFCAFIVENEEDILYANSFGNLNLLYRMVERFLWLLLLLHFFFQKIYFI